jgi:hypothetical protein
MPLKFKAEFDTPAWLQAIRDKQRPVAEAAVAALRDTAANAVQEGRRDIARAGPNFRANWQERLQFLTKGAKREAGEPSLNAEAVVFHKYGIAGVFEHGATLRGKPLIWVPTTRRAPPPGKSGKKLTSATVRGKPMLFDANDRNRHRKPLYIGVKQVVVPKKFHITEIVRKHVKQIAAMFFKNFRDN